MIIQSKTFIDTKLKRSQLHLHKRYCAEPPMTYDRTTISLYQPEWEKLPTPLYTKSQPN